MKLKVLLCMSCVAFAAGVSANTDSDAKNKAALSNVIPNSKIIEQDGSEFDVVTEGKTVVEVEFDREGKIEEASGDAAEAGDSLNPGQGLISLSKAVEALKKSGKSTVGEWSLEKSFTRGWIYEFEGRIVTRLKMRHK